MFRASTILSNARLDKSLELSEVSKKLKIPQKYLQAIELENNQDFPQEPYLSLIVKDYANFLGLNGTETLSIFRRDYEQKRKLKKEKQSSLFFTPQFTFKIGVFISIVIFIAYLISEYLKFNQPPPLEVFWPQPPSPNTETLEIKGITHPESTVRINDDLVIVDSNGEFKKNITIPGATNFVVVVESTSPSGKTSKAQQGY
jgi:hypothetical protein